MSSVGLGELAVIGAICTVLSVGAAAGVGLLYFLLRPKKD